LTLRPGGQGAPRSAMHEAPGAVSLLTQIYKTVKLAMCSHCPASHIHRRPELRSILPNYASSSKTRASENARSSTVALYGDSERHAASARATGGGPMDLDSFSTAAGAAAPPLAPTHGPAAGTLHEGAEYDMETGNAAEAPVAAAAAGVRPPRPAD